jgi:hypothetical protein
MESNRIAVQKEKGNPKLNIWGEQISDEFEFFKLPQNIGQIIACHSNYNITTETKNNTKSSNSYFVSTINNLFKGTAKYENFYIGENGFAEFESKNNPSNIISSFEINFNEITDLYIHHVEHTLNHNYQFSRITFIWLNRNTGKIPYSREFQYNKEADIKSHQIALNFQRNAERSWTLYLFENLENEIKNNDFLIFTMFDYKETSFFKYIKLSFGEIIFIRRKNEFTYKLVDIKRIHISGKNLIIEHKNFQKKLFFIESGDKEIIPLNQLCNFEFFRASLEFLLGYSI